MSSKITAVPITLVGLGSIGISFAALYLKYSQASVSVYDPRPDLEEHIRSVLPVYLDTSDEAFSIDTLIANKRLHICSSLEDACKDAVVVQEQGPENIAFKKSIWAKLIDMIPPTAHMWSSTSGISASKQVADLHDKSRLMVVHPFNPPHIMPLLELVPSPHTKDEEVDFAKSFFHALASGHQPVVIRKEVSGFVGNRLGWVLLREACHLVAEGVVSVEDVDTIVEASLGPRWAVTGPFKSYHYGGGTKGLGGFFDNLSASIEDVWEDAGQESFRGSKFLAGSNEAANTADSTPKTSTWADKVVAQTKEAYGLPTPADFAKRDQALKQVLQARGVKSG